MGPRIHLEDETEAREYLHGTFNQLTGFSAYSVTIGRTEGLDVRADLSVLGQEFALKIVEMSGEVALTNSRISSHVGLQVAGSGTVRLNGGADLQGDDQGYALKSSVASTIDVIMHSDSRIVGEVGGVRELTIDADAEAPATITSSRIHVQRLNVLNGELLLQRQGTEVTGDLRVGSSGALQLQINERTDPEHALVNVSGTTTLERGSNINLALSALESLQASEYTLIRADELVDQGTSINSLNPLLSVSAEVEDDERLVAHIALAGNGDDGEGELEDLDGRLIDQGVSDNGRRAARSFVASVLSRLDEQDPLYQRFLSDDPEEVAQLLEELVPEVSGAAFQAALSASGLTTAALNNRAAALGANAGDLLTETGAWVRVLDGDAKQGRRSGIAGFDADSRGIVVGADGKLNESTTLGLAFSHVRTDVDSQLGQETEVTSNLLSAYGRWEQGRFGITGSLSYGLADNDGKRYVAGEALKSSYDSRTLAAEIEAGYRYDLGNVELEPLLASRYSRVSIDGFREKGSAAALDNGSQDLEVFDLGAGLAVSARLGELTPRARLMAYHDFAQDRIQTTSAFILGGESFIATGADATPWTYEADLGLDWSRGQYTLGVSYDYTRKADFKADTWSLKARYDF